MCPPPIFTINQSIPFHWKRSFWRSDFHPLISSKPPSPQETEHRKRERERGRKSIKKRESKALRISSNKRRSQYFERRKILQLRKPFLYDSIFSPSIIPFQKPFPHH
jgi:hypothetical protein